MDSKIEELMKMFPECVTESRDSHGNLKHSIDFDVLRQILGDEISDEPEAYRFDWVGKNSARIEAYRKIDKTLRPDLDSSLNFDSTENLYIEGDNLDVLKLLQQSYFKKIKLIYIDPPYNTGHDFIYKDRFEMDSEEYAEAIDLFDENGNRKFVENSDSNPRFHSDWCSMIYSRLLLARNLLSDDGAIFISIDDNEQSNLKKICDEVFGERNFVCNVIWEKKYAPQNDAKYLSDTHDFILVYVKDKTIWRPNLLPRTQEMDSRYKNPDNDPRGAWKLNTLQAKSGTSTASFTFPNGVTWSPPAGTYRRYSDETMLKMYEDNRIWFGKDGNGVPQAKKFLTDVKQGSVSKTIWFREEVGDNHEAKMQVKEMIPEAPFDTPKPTRLIRKILQLTTNPDSIVLDFFSGSATTAHAVMQLNSEDHGNRKWIMVQLPEICPENSEAFKSGFKTICEIGKERIRRAGSKFQNIDRGFRVLKLDSTNFRDVSISPEELTREKLFDLIENIKSDRSPLDLLFECLIDWGIELNLKLELEEFEGSTILNYNAGDLIACFDKNISKSVIEYMASKNPNRVVFRDESFSSDSDRINSREIFKLHSPNTRFKVI